MRSARGRSSLTLSCLPRKWMRSRTLSLRARYSAVERSGPSPISMSRAGHGLGDAGEDLDDIGNTLDGAKVG